MSNSKGCYQGIASGTITEDCGVTRYVKCLHTDLNPGDYLLRMSNPGNFSYMSSCIDPDEFAVTLGQLILDLPC